MSRNATREKDSNAQNSLLCFKQGIWDYASGSILKYMVNHMLIIICRSITKMKSEMVRYKPGQFPKYKYKQIHIIFKYPSIKVKVIHHLRILF